MPVKITEKITAEKNEITNEIHYNDFKLNKPIDEALL